MGIYSFEILGACPSMPWIHNTIFLVIRNLIFCICGMYWMCMILFSHQCNSYFMVLVLASSGVHGNE